MGKTQWAKPVQVKPAKGGGKGAGSWVWVPQGGDVGRSIAHSLKAPATRPGGRGVAKPITRLNAQVKPVKAVSKYAEKLKNTDASLKVWIGGLSEKTTWKTLEKHFEAAVEKPSITEIMGKGSAVLAYKTVEQVSEAVASLDGSELDGKNIQVDVWVEKPKSERPPRKAAPKLKPQPKLAAQAVRKVMIKNGKGAKGAKVAGKSTEADRKMKEKLAKIPASQKVWIGGLDEKTTWKQLEKHLAEVAKPKITHIHKGKGVAAYESEEEAATVIAALNGSELAGANLEVDVWTKPEREKKVKAEKEVKDEV